MKIYALIQEIYFKEAEECPLEFTAHCYLGKNEAGEITLLIYEKDKTGKTVNGLQFIADLEPCEKIDTILQTQDTGTSEG